MRSASSAFEACLRGIEKILAVALLAAIGLNFVNVVGRYWAGRTLTGADEVQTYAMVWITFLGAAVVARRGEHLRMDMLVRFLPPAVQGGLRVAELLLVLAIAGFALVQSVRYAASMLRLGAASPMAGVPMWIAHSGVALGLALLLLAVLLPRGSRT
jgi:C4-dicarboxylate transporter DctQ subunit